MGGCLRFRLRMPVVALVVAAGGAFADAADQPDQPTAFKSGVARVTLSVVVRDQNGRIVTTLGKDDFAVVDSGRSRSITNFDVDEGPGSVALLVDVSGSMRLDSHLRMACEAGDIFVASLRSNQDEVALFAFDSALRKVRPFTTDPPSVREAFAAVEPYGSTSIYDAIAEAASEVGNRQGRRAVVVLTDGVDTSSRLTAAAVSGIASGIDVPIYVLATVAAIDRPDSAEVVQSSDSGITTSLADLARWTGGAMFVASSPAQVSVAVRQITLELRHHYLLAIEPGSEPGWHSLMVLARGPALKVRSRTGYWVRPTNAPSGSLLGALF